MAPTTQQKELLPMKVFRAIRQPDGIGKLYTLTDAGMTEIDLDRSLRIEDISPTGFEWGYGGSGPSQTALAILLEATDDEELSLDLYNQFKRDVIAHAPYRGWKIPIEAIDGWIANQDTQLLTIE